VQILLGIPKAPKGAIFILGLFIMKLKQELETRRDQLIKQLEPYKALQKALDEINTALSALNKRDKTYCDGCDSGCEFCRQGPNYR
jgi:hypothetical protein